MKLLLLAMCCFILSPGAVESFQRLSAKTLAFYSSAQQGCTTCIRLWYVFLHSLLFQNNFRTGVLTILSVCTMTDLTVFETNKLFYAFDTRKDKNPKTSKELELDKVKKCAEPDQFVKGFIVHPFPCILLDKDVTITEQCQPSVSLWRIVDGWSVPKQLDTKDPLHIQKLPDNRTLVIAKNMKFGANVQQEAYAGHDPSYYFCFAWTTIFGSTECAASSKFKLVSKKTKQTSEDYGANGTCLKNYTECD